MWKEMHTLPPDGRQSETALMIARGVRRLLRARGFSSITELALTDGRRADIAAVNRDGEVLIVEVKSSPADFRADRKWRDYAACCDRLYFAISEQTPTALMPLEAGLIVADPYAPRSRGRPNCSVWPRPAAGRSCYASPWRPPTGYIVWLIRRLPTSRNSNCQAAQAADLPKLAGSPSAKREGRLAAAPWIGFET